MRKFLKTLVLLAVALVVVSTVTFMGNDLQLGMSMVYGAPLMHNYTTASKAGTGNNYWQSKGGWGVPGGVYGQFVCATCHRPDANNIKAIQGKFTSGKAGQGFPGKTVVYNNTTSAGAMTEAGRNSSQRVCEVCHTQTKHHRYNVTLNATTWNGGGGGSPSANQADTAPHYYGTAQECVSCHSHDKGFIASCTSCHGTPPTTTTIGGPSGLASPATNALGTSPANPGAHAAHSSTMGIACDACHYQNQSQGHAGANIQMGFNLVTGNWTKLLGNVTGFSSYTGNNNTVGYTAKPAKSTIATTVVGNKAATDNSCNVYCHANWPGAQGSVTRPKWAVPGDGVCGTCHFIQGTVASGAAGNHFKHAGSGSANYGFKCSTCHNSVTDTTNHVQGKAQVSFDNQTTAAVGTAAATYGVTAARQPNVANSTAQAGIVANYQTCNALYCHSDGKGGYPTGAAAPTWGNAALGCTSCHGDGNGGNPTGTTDLSGAHATHVNNAATLGYNFTCNECHSATAVSNSALVANPAKSHVTGQVNYSSSTYTRGSANIRRAGSKAVFAYTAAYAGCSATYCHTSGKKGIAPAGAEPAVPAWNSTFANVCKGCHGARTGTGFFVSIAGEPNYSTARSAGASNANSHKKHVTSAADCKNCHRLTTSTGTSILANYSGHLDGAVDARFSKPKAFSNASGVYALATKTCNNTYCHGTSAPRWGDVSLACSSCHNADSALLGRHNSHYEAGVPAATSYTSTPANNSTATAYRFECSACHSASKGAVHADGGVSTNQAADIFFGFTSATRKGTYTAAGALAGTDRGFNFTAGTAGSCSTTYCHSNGTVAGGAPNNTTFTWTTTRMYCQDCHGADASHTNKIASGAHSRHLDPAVNTELGTSNGFLCAECHARTVSFSNNTTITNKAKHVNKFIDYSGPRAQKNYNAGTGQCSSLYCHSSAKPGTAVNTYANPNTWNSGTTGKKCNYCHGTQVQLTKDTSNATFTALSSLGAPNYTTGTAGSATANSHIKHVQGAVGTVTSRVCYDCHRKTLSSATAASPLFRPYSTTHSRGSINVAFSPAMGVSASMDGTKTCSSVYCHGTGTPQWGGASLACSSCHSADSALLGRHNSHIESGAPAATSYTAAPANNSSATAYNFSCSACHSADKGALHANGAVGTNQAAQVFFGFTSATRKGTYTAAGALAGTDRGFNFTAGTAGSCSTTYCHSNGTAAGGAPYNTTFTWTTTRMYCQDCHGADASHTNKIASGAHSRHLDPAVNTELGTSNGFLCAECHARTVSFSNNTTITNKAKHINKFIDYSGPRAQKNYNAGTGQCSSLYCHSSGKPGTAVNTYANPAAWNSGVTGQKCNYCHGTQVQLTKDVSNTAFTALSSLGAPNYTTGAAGSATANSHKIHIVKLNSGNRNSLVCYDCHRRTLDSSTGTAAKFRPYSSTHSRGSINAAFSPAMGASASYNGSKQCSNVVCHGSTTPQWGGAALNCDGCHPRASLLGAHPVHINSGAATPTAYLNLTSNTSVGASYNYGCSVCHPLTNANHGKGPIPLDLVPAAAGGSLKAKNGAAITAAGTVGTASSGTSGTSKTSVICNNVYCHSNGGGAGQQLASTTYYASPDWYGTVSGSADKCSMCHGNMPNSSGSFGARIGSPAHYNTNWLGYTNVSSGHSLGLHDKNISKGSNQSGLLVKSSTAPSAHGNAATSTTINCNACHNLTVKTFVNDRNNVCAKCHVSGPATSRGIATIADKAYHVNGKLNVTFNNMTGYAIPAQVGSTSYPNYSSSWRRPAGYKASATSADHWNPKKVPSYSGGTCSNIACHNGQSVNWGGTGGTTNCQSCHTDL